MKVIRKINNNCALCTDSKGHQVVAFGKGIGFGKPPYEITLKQIEHVYYDLDDSYVAMLHDLSSDILDVSVKIVEKAKAKLPQLSQPHLVVTLADHIAFAIKRYQENMAIKPPMLPDMHYLYDKEMALGQEALTIIQHDLHVTLPDNEATMIALHLVNAQTFKTKSNDAKIIEAITTIIEDHFHLAIDKNGYNYARFYSHLQYLVKQNGQNLSPDHEDLYQSLVNSLPAIAQCVAKINAYLAKTCGWQFNHDEASYLMLHIHRLYTRENNQSPHQTKEEFE